MRRYSAAPDPVLSCNYAADLPSLGSYSPTTNQVVMPMKNRSKLLFSGAIFACAISPSLAFSQEYETCFAEDVAAGEKNCRKAKTNGSKTPVVLDTITLLSSRAPVDVLKYPGSVTVVDMAEDRAHSTAIQALSSVPGFGTGGDSGRGAGE